MQYKNIIKEKLARKLGGKKDVNTTIGFIDILTDDEVIEVEGAENWQRALGKILSYEEYYPRHQKTIYLFGELGAKEEIIWRVCTKYNIEVILLV